MWFEFAWPNTKLQTISLEVKLFFFFDLFQPSHGCWTEECSSSVKFMSCLHHGTLSAIQATRIAHYMLFTEKINKYKCDCTESVDLKIFVCQKFTFDVSPAKYSLMVICLSQSTSSLRESWNPTANETFCGLRMHSEFSLSIVRAII